MNKKALLVISFGTTIAAARQKTITVTENALARDFPGYDLRRAFTSQKIIELLKTRDGIEIDTVTQAIEKLCLSGYSEVLVQPLHIINGVEYDFLVAELNPYTEKIPKLAIGRPLLTCREDYVALVDALRGELSGFASDEAIVFMGHGSRHPANAAYAALDSEFKDAGFPHVYVGALEGSPSLDAIVKQLKKDAIHKVILMPLMLVAGEHARTDMTGDGENSWEKILKSNGFTVAAYLVGLGEIEKIRRIYIAHARAALGDEDI